MQSSYDVGGELILDEGDAVAQDQLSLLEALNLENVRSRRNLQRFDRDIEVAMFLPQPYKLSPQLDFFLFGHCRRSVPEPYHAALPLLKANGRWRRD
jgi:hypothetical protein